MATPTDGRRSLRSLIFFAAMVPWPVWSGSLGFTDVTASAGAAFDGIDHVHVMRPALCEVFPWVGGRVGGDKIDLPTCGWTVVVVMLERGGVVRGLVTEDGPEGLDLAPVLDQPVPIIMADLVPEMAEQGPIGFMHFGAPLFPLGVVGLGDVHGDDAFGMARQRGSHHGAVRPDGVGEKIEDEPSVRVFDTIGHRQAPLDQRIEKLALGRLQLRPIGPIGNDGQVRDSAIVPACPAEGLTGIGWDQPVANAVGGIGAEDIGLFRVGQRCPLVAILLERRHGELLGDIAQPKTAIHAGAVVEIDNAAAVLTFEEPQENLSVVGPTQRTWQPPVQPCLPR